MTLRIPLFLSTTKMALCLTSLRLMVMTLVGFELFDHFSAHPLAPVYDGIILAIVLFICAVLFISSFYMARRIHTITATAERIISTRDLTSRIPISHADDDLGKLAAVLNRMLNEIEYLVASVRQVSDNIAHDLRTPLTRLRAHIEQLQAGSASPVVRQEEVPALVAECDAILATFNALMRIANIESGRRAPQFDAVPLHEVLQDVVELYEPVASEKNVQLSFAFEPVTIQGDKDLLFQALANLIDNAIKYTPEGGDVVARVLPNGNSAVVTLSDSGPGIADEHKPKVFRRFYRIDACRGKAPGAGLGLSLVEAIIRMHQGRITLSDREPNGLLVTVTL